MREHVAQITPMEACGLLGGFNSRVEEVVPIQNVAQNQYRFRMDPSEQVRTMFDFEDRGLDLLAIYHSHPSGPEGPSQLDLKDAAYPEAIQIIWFQRQGRWICRAYRYKADGAAEVALNVDSGK